MRFRNLQEYYTYVRNKVAKSAYSTDWIPIKLETRSRTRGTIYVQSLKFNDGATLRFTEKIVLNAEGEVERVSYSYQYSHPDGSYFRYDRDPIAAKPVVHEECHLHVNQEEPRFKTHAASFDDVFDFVVAYYYATQ